MDEGKRAKCQGIGMIPALLTCMEAVIGVIERELPVGVDVAFDLTGAKVAILGSSSGKG